MTGALTANTIDALAGIVLLLAAATVAVRWLARLSPNGDFTELDRRIRSWWVMIAVFATAMTLNRNLSLLVLCAVSMLALREYFALAPSRARDAPTRICAYVAVPMQYLWIGLGTYEAFVVFVPLYMLIVMSTSSTLIGGPEGMLRSAGTMHWGLVLTVFAFGHLGFVLALPDAVNPAGGSVGLMLYLVFLTQFSDVVQYVAGKLLGRHKVVPAISPNKTWEGLIAGLVVTVVLAGTLAPFLTPMSREQGVAAGLIIGLGGFLGDISISALKRDAGVKDTGTLIPGHGGILDRIDSLLFAAPLFFQFVHALHYRS